ncbi:MAG TPA: hypothetical protein VFB72_09555 [Verrucomicrobiae bacterium]|nr:hypothetical protein [Verrucomicrobiae bacterium]
MPLFLVAMLLALLAMLLLLLAFVKPYLKRYYNIYYSPEFFPDMFVPQKMIFDSKMFVNIRQNSRAEYLWDGINEIMHTEAHTFILLPNTTGWIVPHRIFRNSTEIQGFKDQLEAFRNRGKSNTSTLLNASAK